MSASAGRVLIIPKGDYSASVTYNNLDMVYYGGKTYVCKKTSLNNLPTNTEYWQLMVEGVAGSYYGTCSTAAATAEKAVTVSAVQHFALFVGASITVKFTNTNTAQNPTINVNGTGAASVVYGSGVITTGSLAKAGTANLSMTYVYDGTHWCWVSSGADDNTIYTPQKLGIGYGTCSTAAATAEKAVTLSGYELVTNGTIAVKFTNAVPASATLKVNNKTAKAIYYRGSAITANIINAGDTATFFYNGSQYHVVAVDNVEKPTFTEASTRANIASGETLPTILGKIKKFFTDLKAIAFSGNATDVAYSSGVTVKAKIDTKADKTDIATVESGTTASRAYSVGELVYVGGTLYRVKTAIASGATFTVGTNVEATSVSNMLLKKTVYGSGRITFTNGQRTLNLSLLTGRQIKMIINVFINGDIPSHFYLVDTQPDSFQISIVLDGSYSTFSGDLLVNYLFDEK